MGTCAYVHACMNVCMPMRTHVQCRLHIMKLDVCASQRGMYIIYNETITHLVVYDDAFFVRKKHAFPACASGVKCKC